MNKYRAQRTVVDNITFDSKKESARYSELKLMERAGIIRDLRLQVPFVFVHNDVKIGIYKADFCYRENGHEITEDVKSIATRDLGVFRLKSRLMLAFYGIEIKIT